MNALEVLFGFMVIIPAALLAVLAAKAMSTVGKPQPVTEELPTAARLVAGERPVPAHQPVVAAAAAKSRGEPRPSQNKQRCRSCGRADCSNA